MKTLKEIYAYRSMIASMVRKDIRGRYLGTILGFLWTFVNPLLQLLVYNVVFSYILRQGIDKYYLFLFVALIPWIFMSTSMTGGSTAVVSEPGMVTKIYFPREVLPIAYVTSNFVNMLLSFLVVFAVVFISGVHLNMLAWLYLPFVMIVEYVMALGIAMISSALTVYFRDLQHILGIVSMIWMYLTPILYSQEIIPDRLHRILRLNPMSPIIESYRDILYYASYPPVTTLLEALAFGIVIVIIGFILFGRLKRGFAEEL